MTQTAAGSTTAPIREEALGRLEHAKAADRVERVDRRRAPGPHRVPEQLVVAPVIAGFRRHRAWFLADHVEAPPMPGLVVAETGIRRSPAGEDACLLGVALVLDVLAEQASEPEARPAPWGDQRRPDARPFSARVLEGDEGRIVDRSPGPATVDLGEDADRLTEQEQRLVDQVRAEVTMRTTRLVRVLAPRVGERRRRSRSATPCCRSARACPLARAT